MRRFTQLYFELDATTKTNEKLAAMSRYFRDVPPEDAVWGLFFLSGGHLTRAVSSGLLRVWAAETADLPFWLVEESYHAVGDLSEALALVLPKHDHSSALSLRRVVEERILSMWEMDDDQKHERVLQTWRDFDAQQRLVWHKLIMGAFRVGVSRTLVIRTLAEIANVPQSVMAHRLMGGWEWTSEFYHAIMSGDILADTEAKPYPFYLAHPFEDTLETLGEPSQWQAEWKYDGIRAQLIRRQGNVIIWSRGEEMVTDTFPEIAEAAQALPDGTVLDGEILAWCDVRPLPFSRLQRRLGRKKVDAKIQKLAPVAFVAYDLLEYRGEDVRERPLAERRRMLQELHASLPSHDILRLSPTLPFRSWQDLESLRETSRDECVEGVMLKRLDAAYGVGRQRGHWWKWKIQPYFVDAVLMYAQLGSGRRASLYTDYTFGIWRDGELLPFAKAYSGLTDAEIRDVDRFIRQNTLERFGPVRVVKPELVFEIAFEGIRASTRHKSGVAVRFPRIARWRTDKPASEADTLESVRDLLPPEERK